MTSPDAKEEVARRVRRVVGLKVLRELHESAEARRREDQQRPWLVLKLVSVVAVLVIVVVLAARLF